MLDQELQALWQQVPPEMQIKFNQSKLMIDLHHKIESFDRTIRQRDMGELIAAVIVIFFFAAVLFYTPHITTRIGCGIIIGYSFFVIAKLVAVKRFKQTPQPNDSFKTYLEQARFYLLKEKRLLETVLYWYILPLFAGYLFFGLGDPLAANHGLYWIFYGLYLLFGVAVGCFIWWINRHAVKTVFNPLLQKIEDVLETL